MQFCDVFFSSSVFYKTQFHGFWRYKTVTPVIDTQGRTGTASQMFPSHLLSRHVHVPDDDAAVTAAGDELAGVRGVAQTLNFITAQKPHGKRDLSNYTHIKKWNTFSSVPSCFFEVQRWTGISLFLLVSLQFDGGPFATPDVPHDDGVVWAAGEQHPLDGIPAQRSHVTCSHSSKRVEA